MAAIIQNAHVARKEKLAICQDTGLPVVFLEVGQGVCIKGDVQDAIQKGVAEGYRKGSFRTSIIKDPLSRGIPSYAPVVVHTELVKGEKIKITVLPKGFGCENKTQLKMFLPTAGWPQVKSFIVEAVRLAEADACPPYVVGVGLGGTSDYACILAKKALLRKVSTSYAPRLKSRMSKERELLDAINALHIGPMGLGGNATALAVHIEKYPTHIAGLAVCVNVSCHALRSATVQL